MNDCIDLILGKAFFIFIFFSFLLSHVGENQGIDKSFSREIYNDNCGRLCSRARYRCVTLKNCLTVAKRHTNRMSNNRVFSLILNENFAVPYSSQTEKNSCSLEKGNRYVSTLKGIIDHLIIPLF